MVPNKALPSLLVISLLSRQSWLARLEWSGKHRVCCRRQVEKRSESGRILTEELVGRSIKGLQSVCSMAVNEAIVALHVY